MPSRRVLWAVSLLLAVCTRNDVIAAQSPAIAPAFEVASVKPNTSGATARRFGMPADRFEAVKVSLREMLMVACGEPRMRFSRLTGVLSVTEGLENAD